MPVTAARFRPRCAERQRARRWRGRRLEARNGTQLNCTGADTIRPANFALRRPWMRHRIGVWLAAVFVGALGVMAPASSAFAQNVYELKASPTNVHWGYFSAAVKPALT